MGKFTAIPESGSVSEGTPIAGLRGTGDWAADERPTDFREFILFRNPNGTAPFTALMSKMGKESCKDPEFHWWDEPNDILRLQVAGNVAQAGLTITVDSTDPTASVPDAVYGNALNLKTGDLLMVELNAAQVAAGEEDVDITNHEIVRVNVVSSATSFTVVRAQAGTSAPAGADSIPDNAFLVHMGSAYEEGSDAADATTRNPIKFTNYCQIFKTSYELTNTAREVSNARTGDVESNDKKRKVWDHSRQLEMAMMFGQAFETTGSAGKPLRFMGGLREFIPASNTTVFNTGGNVDLDTFMDAINPMFEYDTPAGDERIGFCGNAYLNQLNSLAKLNGDIQFGPIIKQFGMNLRQVTLPQGTIYLRRHPLMNRHGLFKGSCFYIDASAVKYRYLRDTKAEDNIQLPGADKKKGQWLTECSLETRYAGLTLGYHGNLHNAIVIA